MASNYNGLGFQLMTTGEKAGTWGTETNTTWNEVRDTFGYITVAMTADRTLTIPDGSTGTYDGRAFIIECNGALGANRVLDIAVQAGSGSSPGGAENIEKPFIIYNNTSTAYTLTFKVTGATGFVLEQGATYLCYHNGTDIINTGLIGASTTDTLTNKTLTSPKIVTSILDTNGLELALITATGSAVNEFTIANAAAGAGPTLSSTGDEANVDINLNPKGSGVLKSGTAAVKIAGTETIFVPAQAMFGTTTNGAEANAVETTATRPEMKVLDFDASTIEYAQFSIAMPKSWNEGTLTFQAFWSPSNTDTGAALIGLQGISVANDATSDVAFPTAVDVTDNGTGTVEDVLVSPVSAAVTVTSAAADTYTYFQVARNATSGSDSFTGDVRLLGIKLFYTTDAANDA